MKKPSYKEALDKFNSLKLSAYDFGGDRSVLVTRHHGSVLLFKSAFALKWRGWWMVYTEHDGYHVYDEDEDDVLVTAHARELEPLNFSKFKRDPKTVEYFEKSGA